MLSLLLQCVTLALAILFFLPDCFAQSNWTNPYVCDPSNVKDCWIYCYNSKSVMEGERRHEVYVTPMKNGAAKFILLRETILSGHLKVIESGKLMRRDNIPLNIQLRFNSKAQMAVSTTPDRILLNNGWILKGGLELYGNVYDMFCKYGTKVGLDNSWQFKPEFPIEFYRSYYETP